MAAAQSGEAASYRRLLELLGPWLDLYYSPRLPIAMVEYAVKDTLIAIHEKRHTYDASQSFERWLSAIALYKWPDYLREIGRDGFDQSGYTLFSQGYQDGALCAPIFEDLLATIKGRREPSHSSREA